jgi:hypothetical protein
MARIIFKIISPAFGTMRHLNGDCEHWSSTFRADQPILAKEHSENAEERSEAWQNANPPAWPNVIIHQWAQEKEKYPNDQHVSGYLKAGVRKTFIDHRDLTTLS